MSISARSATRGRRIRARVIASAAKQSSTAVIPGRALARTRNLEIQSGIEPEMHHVAVGDDIVLAFQPQFAGVAGAGLAAKRDIIGIADGFGADEALLEIGMNDAGGGRRPGAAVDGPGPRFLRADGEIGDEVEQPVAGAD